MYDVGRKQDIAYLRQRYRSAKSPRERNLVCYKAQAIFKQSRDKTLAQLRFNLIRAERKNDSEKSNRARYAIMTHSAMR